MSEARCLTSFGPASHQRSGTKHRRGAASCPARACSVTAGACPAGEGDRTALVPPLRSRTLSLVVREQQAVSHPQAVIRRTLAWGVRDAPRPCASTGPGQRHRRPGPGLRQPPVPPARERPPGVVAGPAPLQRRLLLARLLVPAGTDGKPPRPATRNELPP